MTHHTHLSDDRLIEVSLDRFPSAIERQHLGACAACEARREDLSRLLAATVSAATAEADGVFTPERLTRQRTRILQRLEHEGRPGKVVTFPAGQMHHARPLRTRPGMRWVAGAAAAGVVIGMLAGHYAPDFRLQGTRPSSFTEVRPEAAALQTVSTTMSEEELLGRLEMAIDGTGGATLRPLHDLTPLAWEVSAP
jgi:hypothetical protein